MTGRCVSVRETMLGVNDWADGRRLSPIFASRARRVFDAGGGDDAATARTCWPRSMGCADSLSEQGAVHEHEHGEYGEHDNGEHEAHEHGKQEHGHEHGEHGQSASHQHDEHEQHKKQAEHPSGGAHDAGRIS